MYLCRYTNFTNKNSARMYAFAGVNLLVFVCLDRIKAGSQYYDAGCCVASHRINFRTSGKTLSSLGWKQERYVGYAGIEFGSIPASRCVSTAFQRGMMRRNAAPSIIL